VISVVGRPIAAVQTKQTAIHLYYRILGLAELARFALRPFIVPGSFRGKPSLFNVASRTIAPSVAQYHEEGINRARSAPNKSL
jgi:hypothetical protein